MITWDRLIELLQYDSASGVFTWKHSRSNQIREGARAGCTHIKGYTTIEIDGQEYKAATLAWFYYYGIWPISIVDHKDRCNSNDRIKNLRLVTKQQNCSNTKLYRNNKSGHRGVALDKKSGKYRAYIRVDKKIKHLGFFLTIAEAGAAWELAAKETYGEFTGQLQK